SDGARCSHRRGRLAGRARNSRRSPADLLTPDGGRARFGSEGRVTAGSVSLAQPRRHVPGDLGQHAPGPPWTGRAPALTSQDGSGTGSFCPVATAAVAGNPAAAGVFARGVQTPAWGSSPSGYVL